MFIVFGEHARELISPELGLFLIETLCGEHSELYKPEVVSAQLAKNSYQFVVVANPASRAKVEAGEFCLRANEHGVDLNRNWDEHWEKGDPKDDV